MCVSYYAVELCRYSVKELIKNKDTETLYKNVWDTLSREEIMHQTALGLDYLHGLEGNIIHRNIHARNVLVAEIVSGSNARYVVKLSDFLFSKSIMNEWDQQQSNRPFPSGWTAPEIENKDHPEAKLGPWTDVFILACFFYYILSRGHHPYGKRNAKNVPNRSTNIKNKEYCWPKQKIITESLRF